MCKTVNGNVLGDIWNNWKIEIASFSTVTQIIARGKILDQWVKLQTVGVISSFRFRILPEMTPSSRLVAFFFGQDGEVVADSTLLKIDDGLPNKVTSVHEFLWKVRGGVLGCRITLDKVICPHWADSPCSDSPCFFFLLSFWVFYKWLLLIWKEISNRVSIKE